jgi:hypothetical protein
MGISKVLLFRQVIYHKSIHPLCQMEIIRFANSFLSFHKQEIRDFIETTATLPPRLLNAESAEKESLQATAIEHPWLCYCKVGKKPLRKDSLVSCLGYPSGWFCKIPYRDHSLGRCIEERRSFVIISSSIVDGWM